MGYNLKELLLNLIYPPRCVFCGGRLSPKTKTYVCSKCANELPYARAYARCRRCGKPVSGEADGVCARCYRAKSYNSRITSAFVYTDIARQAVVSFKKERNAGNAKMLSAYIAEMVKHDFGGVAFDCIVSVPPRRDKLKSGGYDQAAQLARAVSLRLGVPYVTAAMEQKGSIKKQSSLSYADRFSNVEGKYIAKKPGAAAGKTVLIIDDVMTSGATLEECAKVLRKCGAYRVYSATLATVPDIS